MEKLIRKLTREYCIFDEVEAITLAGSRASHRNDKRSDIDIDVFITKPISIEKRREIASKFATEMEIGNEFFGSGDEYFLTDTSVEVDVCYFDLKEIMENLIEVMDEHKARTGYTTCFVHNIVNAHILYDKCGKLKQLQETYQGVYPAQLKENIIKMNYPILRSAFSSYYHQIEKAIKRHDLNSINHRVTAFLASYYDIIFALNEMPHPGEKRLLSIIETACPICPENFQIQIKTLIAAIGLNHKEVLNQLNALVDDLEEILKTQNLI